MRRALGLLSIVAVLVSGGLAALPGAVDAAELSAFTGEVWLWDTQENIVTLRQAGGTIRVQVTSAELARLRLHEVATVRGTPAPPQEIEQVEVTSQAVPTATMDHAAATATVRTVAPDGVMAIDSDHGPLTVLVATPVGRRYDSGDRILVETAVQAMKLVPKGTPADSTTPALAPKTEPGDSVIVTGPVLSVEASGRMRIESPRGPIALWLPNAHRFSVGEFVRVRMFTAATP